MAVRCTQSRGAYHNDSERASKREECRYERFLEDDKPKKKAPVKGDAFQIEFDELQQAATDLAEVRRM